MEWIGREALVESMILKEENKEMSKEELIEELKKIVGSEYVQTSQEDLMRIPMTQRPGHTYLPDVVESWYDGGSLRIMKLANANRVPVYTRGSGTNLPGGDGTSEGRRRPLMLRFNKIIDVDLENLIAEVEAGVIVQVINDHIAQYGLIYPPDPGTCQDSESRRDDRGELRRAPRAQVRHHENYVQGSKSFWRTATCCIHGRQENRQGCLRWRYDAALHGWRGRSAS